MNELPSSEFRKRYPKLREPTNVIVLGRIIGTWLPATETPPKPQPKPSR
jgi:hypothetical protein